MAITINTFEIIENGAQIALDVSTEEGYIITSVKLWKMDDFKDYSKALDVSYKLEQVNETETIIIYGNEVSQKLFEDIWYVEIESSFIDEDDNCDIALGITYNLTNYYSCMLEYLLKNGLGECTNCNNSTDQNITIMINLLLDTVKKCIDMGYYIQASETIAKLKKLCKSKQCTNCQPVECSTCSKFKQIL